MPHFLDRLLINVSRHHPDIWPPGPTHPLPKTNALDIFMKNEEVTLLDTNVLQGSQAPVNKPATNALPSILGMHGQVMNVTPPAIVAAQYRPGKFAVAFSDKAHTGIPVKVGLDALSGVGAAEANAFSLQPQVHHPVIGVDSKW
jgi:hypothetical protein